MSEIRTVIDDVTLEETAASVQAAFPYRSKKCVQSELPDSLCPWHWHNEVEFFYMECGSLRYSLPGLTVDYLEGDVGFVNANVLHMTRRLGGGVCVQQEHIFLPRLVAGSPGSAIERRYVQPLLQNREADYLRVPADHPRAAVMRAHMDAAYAAFQRGETGFEIDVRAGMSALWLEILALSPRAAAGRGSADDTRVKAMLQFIDANYAERLTLSDIAAAASVGPREAARCFRRQLGVSPFEYLLDYRVDRAAELLRSGGHSVTDVSMRCGFSSVSYFGRLFREKLGVPPSAYRRMGSAREGGP